MMSHCRILAATLCWSFVMMAACCHTAQAANVSDKNDYLSDITKAMTVLWPKNHTIHIVCHGHSVPSGYFKTPVVDTFNAYPHLLHVGLKERYPHAVMNVIVTGIGGENSIAGEKRFADEVLNHKPELITIDYGLNDRRVGLAQAKAAWTSMITQAKSHNIKVILLTPTPDQKAKMDDPNDPLNQHAEQIRLLAAEHSVGLVDSLKTFKQKIASGTPLPDLMSQVNHPNRAGHDLVTAELMSWFPK